MFLGSCLCGAVKYTIQMEQLDDITLCHCHNCQKASGSAFNAVTPVAAENFQVEDEQGVLKHTNPAQAWSGIFVGNAARPYSASATPHSSTACASAAWTTASISNPPNTFTTLTVRHGSASTILHPNIPRACKHQHAV